MNPLVHAGIDGFGALIEALWGIRWFKFIFSTNQKTLPKFTFGKQEVLYTLYSFILLTPFMIDDPLFAKGFGNPYVVKAYVILTLALALAALRFELLFPALALKEKTSFRISWSKSKPLWSKILLSYLQATLIIACIGIILLLGLSLILLMLWAVGLLNFEHWHMENGWQILLNRNPLIQWLYVASKESLWFLAQAFTMVIAARYYKIAKKKS